jgi:hypothetical protein
MINCQLEQATLCKKRISVIQSVSCPCVLPRSIHDSLVPLYSRYQTYCYCKPSENTYFTALSCFWVPKAAKIGKTIRLRGRGEPKGREMSWLQSQIAPRLSSLRPGRPLSPGRFLALIMLGWVNPRGIVRLEEWGKLKKKSNHLIECRTRDLPICLSFYKSVTPTSNIKIIFIYWRCWLL